MGNCCTKRQQAAVAPYGRSWAARSPDARLHPDNEELRKVFNEFDADGDGYIVFDELKTAMMNMGARATDDEIKAMFEAADINSDGKISYEEFTRLAKANPAALSLKSVFSELDGDGDGYITRQELFDAFKRMGHPLSEEEAAALCVKNDLNFDGKLSFDEFVRMMCRERK